MQLMKKNIAVNIENANVRFSVIFIRALLCKLLSAPLCLASSGTRILERLQSMLDGKNKAGITIASNMPNWLNASEVEFPYCFSVIGTRASLALLGTDVTRLLKNIGIDEKMKCFRFMEQE